MQILDYPTRPLRDVPLTEEDRQLLSQCYREIGELMKSYDVTIVTAKEIKRAPSAHKPQAGKPNA